MPIRPLIIGSRGSDLALWQANHIKDTITRRYPEIDVEIRIIKTTGDRDQNSSLAVIGGKGAFTKEIEDALLRKEIDLAVHSLKDLPTELDERLTVAMVPEREDVRDVFISREPGRRIAELQQNAWVATGSMRRKAQLLKQRNDLQIADIRGNVPTRIKKLKESDWDGMILASAGVTRLGLTEHISEYISTEWILPAVGQGALGIETRSDDAELIELLTVFNHHETLTAVTAERALLNAMGGGCQVPIGAMGRVVGDKLTLVACVAHPEGLSLVRGEHTGSPADAAGIGQQLAQTLLENGAREILEHVYRLQKDSQTVSPP
ncbi:MAG TPA: hydroxymethylbilane synthase [Candidatus Kapabacteria bacterium]|nr:hydroxymethylbilane synthase [Candidatus Kapabacteria bacterium]